LVEQIRLFHDALVEDHVDRSHLVVAQPQLHTQLFDRHPGLAVVEGPGMLFRDRDRLRVQDSHADDAERQTAHEDKGEDRESFACAGAETGVHVLFVHRGENDAKHRLAVLLETGNHPGLKKLHGRLIAKDHIGEFRAARRRLIVR